MAAMRLYYPRISYCYQCPGSEIRPLEVILVLSLKRKVSLPGLPGKRGDYQRRKSAVENANKLTTGIAAGTLRHRSQTP